LKTLVLAGLPDPLTWAILPSEIYFLP